MEPVKVVQLWFNEFPRDVFDCVFHLFRIPNSWDEETPDDCDEWDSDDSEYSHSSSETSSIYNSENDDAEDDHDNTTDTDADWTR